MTIRSAQTPTPGVKMFYVTGDSDLDYVVQFIRRAGIRTVSCTCPDFIFRRQRKRTHRACKHIRAVREGKQ